MTLVVPDEVTVDLASMTLDQLAERANAEHAEAGKHFSAALVRAISCGEALLEAKARFPYEGWGEWCEANIPFAPKSFMRLAYYKDHLPKGPAQENIHNAHRHFDPGLSMNEAVQILRGLPALPAARYFDQSKYPSEWGDEARQMHASGMSPAEIADLMNVSRTWVMGQVDPGYRARQRAGRARYMKRKRAEVKALKEKEAREELARLAKEKGGDLGRLHDLFRRRVMPMIDGAVNEGLSIEARALAVRLEDEINKALRA